VEQEGLVLQVHLERLAVRGAQVVLEAQARRVLVAVQVELAVQAELVQGCQRRSMRRSVSSSTSLTTAHVSNLPRALTGP